MQLQLIDWLIALGSIAVCFIPAFFYAKRARKSTTEFFASGRSVPWWLAGLSMVATTFSADTPNLVTNIVRTQGVSGNWVWWAFVLTGLSTVFFYAQLWRRSGVMTDLEFYELRYSGKAASALRGFRAVYLGFLFNILIMASVNLAGCKIANILFGIPAWQTLLFLGVLNVFFAAESGLWGVLVIDMIQFFVKMTAVVAAAYFALQLPQVGGLHGMVDKLATQQGPKGINYLNILPDFRNNWDLALAVFVLPLAVQWWAVWYPGAEPGGGSYIAQRMLASKSEKDSLGAVLFFNVAHYVLRPWPWILVGLCSLIVYPTLGDIQKAFPDLDPKLLGHDIAYPAMLKFLPPGFAGLMIGGLVAASSSTILTHLNWGASYLIHDFYRRFVRRDATEKHYVMMGRVATVGLLVASALMTLVLTSAKDTFDIILQVGAGTGLLYLIRWFWWRINAWCEIVAMVSSFVISFILLLLKNAGVVLGDGHFNLPITIAVTTVCWILAAFLAPQTDQETLVNFYLKVRPPGPGWETIRRIAGAPKQDERDLRDNIPLSLLGWFTGSIFIWSALFALGNFLYGRMMPAALLAVVALVTGGILIAVINRLWSSPSADTTFDGSDVKGVRTPAQ